MPMDVLQAVDACVGITTALVKACQFVIDYQHAGDIAKETAATAQDVDKILRQTRNVLRHRTSLPPENPLCDTDTNNLASIGNAAEKCRETLQRGIKSIFGKDAAFLQSVDFKNLTASAWKRARIAFHSGNAATLTGALQRDLTLLTLNFHLLQIVDSSYIRQSQDNILQAIMLQHNAIRRFETRFQQLRGDLEKDKVNRNNLSGKSNAIEEAAPACDTNMPKTFSSVSLQDLEETGSNADNIWRSLVLPVSDSRRSHSTRDTGGSNGSPVSKQDSGIDMPATDARSDTTNPGPAELPLSTLETLIEHLRLATSEAKAKNDWIRYRQSLEKLITECRNRARSYSKSFDDESALTEELVLLLLGLHQWQDAHDAIESAERQFQTRLSGWEGKQSKSRDPQMSQLRALVHLVKYEKSQNYRTRVTTVDLEKAREHANVAYKVYHDNVRELASDESKEQLRKSARLFATILALYNDDEDAIAVLEDTAKLCGSERDNLFEYPYSRTPEETSMSSPGESTPPDVDTRLVVAIKQGLSDEDFTAHLKNHPHEVIDSTDDNGSSALHIALEKDRPQLVQQLLQRGANTALMNNARETPLLIAIKAANCELVEQLSGHEESVDTIFADDRNCLHYAIGIRDTEVTATLLASEFGAKLVGLGDDSGMTALHWCADNERPDHATIILQHSSDAHIDLKDSSDKTALDICLAKASTTATQQVVDAILDKHSGDPVIQATKKQQRALEDHKRRRARELDVTD